MKRKLYTTITALAVVLLGAVPVAAVGSAPDGGAVDTAPSAQVALKPAAQQKDPQASGPAALAAVCEYPANATNPYAQSKVVSSSTARFYNSTAWTNLECGQLTITVPRGKQAALVAQAGAELTCTGPTPDETQWCQGRVLVNGTEGYPRETEADGSFAWAQSSPDVGAWEANSMPRALQLRCPESSTTQTPCSWNLQTQVRNHVDGLNFRVDGSLLWAHLTYM